MRTNGQIWTDLVGKTVAECLIGYRYDNRLPRGKTYANKGAVETLKIKDNRIQAKVSGSQKRPYVVTIITPPFEPKMEDRLVDEISKNPVLIAKLLNRELDPQLLQIAESLGVKVFPKTWSDFKMNCSCPDWAVPCKHIAAIIYKMSSEIDNNPFLVFEPADGILEHHGLCQQGVAWHGNRLYAGVRPSYPGESRRAGAGSL